MPDHATNAPCAEAASLIAARLGVLLKEDGPFRVRVWPAVVDGDLPLASLEVQRDGRYRAFGVVSDLKSMRCAALLGWRQE